MNHIQKDLANLKEGIDSAKTNLAKLEGVESEILHQLKKEYGISSVEEAKTMLNDLTKELEDHKNWHRDVGNPMLEKHDRLLIGPDGNDGLCLEVSKIVDGFKTIRNLGYGVIAAIVIDLVTRLMNLPAAK